MEKKDFKGEGPKLSPDFCLMIRYNPLTKTVQVQGGIADIGLCYHVLEMAKDCIRKWNELNNGYLKAEKVAPDESKG